MPDALTVTRHDERPTVAFPGGATYQPIVGDDTGAGVPIRTGIRPRRRATRRGCTRTTMSRC